MVRRLRAPALLLLAAALVGGGCASSNRDQLKAFEDALQGYNEAFRWKNFERAALFLPPDLRAAFVAAHEDDEKSLHVEDYQVLRADLDGEDRAVVTIRLSYTLLPSLTVERRNLVQHWARVAGTWILESEENSIRKLEPNAVPRSPGAVRSPGERGGDEDLEIEVTGPDGKVIRREVRDPDSFGGEE